MKHNFYWLAGFSLFLGWLNGRGVRLPGPVVALWAAPLGDADAAHSLGRMPGPDARS